MLKKLIIGVLVMVFAIGSLLAGQNTGGDKERRTTTAVAPGLNPQPLPPGRHHYRHHRHRGVSANYSPQWGGFHRSQNHRNPDALTVKQK